MNPSRGSVLTPRLIAGLFIAAAGTLLAADRFGLIDAQPFWQHWPLFLIATGLVKLFQRGRGKAGGVVLIALGSYFMARKLAWVDFTFSDLVPFLLVFMGLSLVVTAITRRGGRSSDRSGVPDSSSLVHAFAMVGGTEQATSSADFQGGTATAIMGSCEIDLRQAAIANGEAVIDTFAFWGGVSILVPEGWSVALRGMPILGGFEDKTVPPPGGSTQRLVVKGLAIMGGVEIKNKRDRG